MFSVVQCCIFQQLHRVHSIDFAYRSKHKNSNTHAHTSTVG